MILNRLIEKHQLKSDVLDGFSEQLTNGASLKDMSEKVGLDPEKTYALLKVYCREILGEDIEDVAPDLADQRSVLAKAKIKKIANQIEAKTHREVLKNILEDLMLLSFERKNKARMEQ